MRLMEVDTHSKNSRSNTERCGSPTALTTRALLTAGIFFVIASASGCYRSRGISAWTTGEPNAPPDVAAVYRAVLDEIFPERANGPTLVVIDRMTQPGRLESLNPARRPGRISSVAIAPFSYRVPIAFIDTTSLRELSMESRKADSTSYTLPMTDIRHRQGVAGPFLTRYPGAWGRLTLSRVVFGPGMREASLAVAFLPSVPGRDYGDEVFRLIRTTNQWKVVERIPHEGMVINAQPIPYVMLHAWVDSSLFPAPKRRSVRGTVKDSASGRPLPGIVIRVNHAPLGKYGQLLSDKGPEPWGTTFTDARGEFVISNPPSGFASMEAECPPSRDVRGAWLVPVALNPESGLDTVLNFRVRFALCAELAPEMAREAERQRKDVERAKGEAAARVVQGNIWGTLRDARTGNPVPRGWMRVDEGGGMGQSDSTGHFWLWGFAPGKHKVIVYCPVRRQWPSKVATTVSFHAPPAMKDTMDIQVDLRGCTDVPVDTVRVRTHGVLSEGFEDGFFTPCKPFNQIQLGGYLDFSGLAFLGFAREKMGPPEGWPHVKVENGYYKIFMDVEGDLIGPGSYGHLGLATYKLIVTRVISAKAATKTSCGTARRRD
jgi:hypothetical protein